MPSTCLSGSLTSSSYSMRLLLRSEQDLQQHAGHRTQSIPVTSDYCSPPNTLNDSCNFVLSFSGPGPSSISPNTNCASSFQVSGTSLMVDKFQHAMVLSNPGIYMRLIMLQVTSESLSRKRRPDHELQHTRSMVLNIWKLGEERLEWWWKA
jgi:hypothetical protein